MSRISREYVSGLDQLAEIRTFVTEACSQAWGSRGDADFINEMVLAVQEAAANIIQHAYEGKADQPIEVVLDADPSRICVCLYHKGRDFDPKKVRSPSFDGSRHSGFGLYIMRQLVDELRYVRDGANRRGIRLVKSRRRSPEGG